MEIVRILSKAANCQKSSQPSPTLIATDPMKDGTAWLCHLILALLALQFLPYALLWGEAYIRIHDTLEGEWLWYHLLFENEALFDFRKERVLPQIMDGLPRRFLHSPFSLEVLWISLFGLYGGYLFNYCLTHLIGFVGMYRLLRVHVLTPTPPAYISMGIALCFSWMPSFTVFGLSLFGLPLLAHCLLCIFQGRGLWMHHCFVLLFPFYSSVVWAGPAAFVLAASLLGLVGLRGGNWQLRQLVPFAMLALGYLVADWPLFEFAFDSGGFVSQREEYDYFYNKKLSFAFSIQESLQLLFIGHYHIGTLISLPILFALLVVLLRRSWTRALTKCGGVLLLLLVFYGAYNWLVYWGADFFPLLQTYKFSRIGILVPVLLFVLFGLALERLSRGRIWSKSVLFLMTLQLVNCMASNDEFVHNMRQLAGQSDKPNFEEFYAADLFGQIKQFIGQPTDEYRVVSLGLHPAIAQYNGLYTLDAHQSLYSLAHKQAFRKIIEAELAKNETIRKEFDDFGNRCYVFSAELGKNEGIAFMQSKRLDGKVEQLDINCTQLYAMGARYLLSAVDIRNTDALGLQLLQTFETPKSYWRIHLYSIPK